MNRLVVRAYNVGFGEAILVTVPDKSNKTGKETIRHILFDVGNLAVGAGSGYRVFEPVVKDILKRIGRKSVDLYIMTHEHYDHVTGLYDAHKRYGLGVNLDYAWLTASSATGYYARHPAARRRRDLIDAHYRGVVRYLATTKEKQAKALKHLMKNNDPKRTRTRVQFLKSAGGASKHTTYVHAAKRLKRKIHHSFEEARLTVLAPEEDTACYPLGLMPLPLMMGSDSITGGRNKPYESAVPKPPNGVDPKAFARLLQRRKRGLATDILAIDKAANNTSIVLMLEWRGWRLLFTGDAEEASWIMMERQKRALKPVHFLKVSHHGSINGTPDDSILESILPINPTDSRERTALVSTCPGTHFGDIPHGQTLKRLAQRGVTVRSTTEVSRGKAVEISFEA